MRDVNEEVSEISLFLRVLFMMSKASPFVIVWYGFQVQGIQVSVRELSFELSEWNDSNDSFFKLGLLAMKWGISVKFKDF